MDAFGAAVLPTLARHRYDVVHALVPSAALAARACAQRTVYTVIGHPTADQLAARPVDRHLATWATRTAHAVTALSRASCAQVLSCFGREAKPLPPGVRLDRFPLRSGPGPLPPRILFSADLSDPRKGLDLAVAALPEVLAAHPGARLVLSGPGDHRWALERLPAGTAERVEASIEVLGTGAPDDVPRRYREATVTVLPARHEAFGLALVESLASGTPVVCADDGGMPEIADNDAVGRRHRVGDPHDLARAVLEAVRLAGEATTAARCAEHARRWSWNEAVGPMHEHLYRAVAAGGRPSRRGTPSGPSTLSGRTWR